jgi:hypothetical protein
MSWKWPLVPVSLQIAHIRGAIFPPFPKKVLILLSLSHTIDCFAFRAGFNSQKVRP